jgi:hypothetical protein
MTRILRSLEEEVMKNKWKKKTRKDEKWRKSCCEKTSRGCLRMFASTLTTSSQGLNFKKDLIFV